MAKITIPAIFDEFVFSIRMALYLLIELADNPSFAAISDVVGFGWTKLV
jgi:hypothetical protein